MGPSVLVLPLIFLTALCHQSRQQNMVYKKEFLDGVPECSIPCINQVMSDLRCQVHDKGCYCADYKYKSMAITCFTGSCPVGDSLVAQKSIYINCQSLVANESLRFKAVAIAFSILDVYLGADDWMILLTAIIHVPANLATAVNSPYDGRSSISWAPLDRTISANLHNYINTNLYYLISASLKLTFLLFYLRIFPSGLIRRLLWGTVVLTCAYGIAYVVASIFQCTPVEYYWQRWDPTHQGKCIDMRNLSLSHAGLGIALDLWILGIPIPQLYQLQLGFWKKIGMGVVLSLGVLVTLASIIRLERLAIAFTTEGMKQPAVRTTIAIWFVVECSIGIICASLPTVYCGVVFFFPQLNFWRDTPRRSHSDSRVIGRSDFRRSMRGTLKNSDDDDNKQAKASRIIGFQQNFSLDVKDVESNDEARLVPLTELSASRGQETISINSD